MRPSSDDDEDRPSAGPYPTGMSMMRIGGRRRGTGDESLPLPLPLPFSHRMPPTPSGPQSGSPPAPAAPAPAASLNSHPSEPGTCDPSSHAHVNLCPLPPGPPGSKDHSPSKAPDADFFSDSPDLRPVTRTVTRISDSGPPSFMRSYQVRSELRLHGQITHDGGLAIDWETVQQMEKEFEDDGEFQDLMVQEVLNLGTLGASCRLPRSQVIRHADSGPYCPGQSGKPRGVKTIVMMVVGTRGDVQPFIGIGLKLKEYGHRVRIASHKEYKPWVLQTGLEFFPLGGDPRVLSEFVCKHRGVVPNLQTSSIRDVLAQSMQVDAIINSTYPAACDPDPETGLDFRPDMIIANPPSFGHVHVAEKLNVPLHIIFTMPWTPTKFCPQPFARTEINLRQEDSPDGPVRKAINWYSYFGVDKLQWLGMSSMITRFRKEVLGFTGPMTKKHCAHALYYAKVPFTYIWSPSLAERPADWPSYCKVVGFVNMDLKKLSAFEPPEDLQRFLDAGDPPVYIGFGSLVVDNPDKLTRYFMEAIQATGMRAFIQKGWGGLGASLQRVPPEVFLIEKPVPHDWLFPRCSAVIHHGGAGTTAMGLYCGKPTFIVPFFGDQPFWGAACFKAGVGPAPVAIDQLNRRNVEDALKTLICPACRTAAKVVQERMLTEDGIQGTVDHVHETLDTWAAAAAAAAAGGGPEPSGPSRKSSKSMFSPKVKPQL